MIEILEALQVVLLSIAMALIYGLTAYAKTNTDENLDTNKLASTLIISVVVAGILVLTGNPITQTGIETQLAAYGILTIVVENVLKMINRKILPKLQ